MAARVTGRDQQSFIGVDIEFHFETRFTLFRGWIDYQESDIVFIHPEQAAPFLFVGRDLHQADRASWIENQLQRRTGLGLPHLAHFKDSEAQLGLTIVR